MTKLNLLDSLLWNQYLNCQKYEYDVLLTADYMNPFSWLCYLKELYCYFHVFSFMKTTFCIQGYSCICILCVAGILCLNWLVGHFIPNIICSDYLWDKFLFPSLCLVYQRMFSYFVSSLKTEAVAHLLCRLVIKEVLWNFASHSLDVLKTGSRSCLVILQILIFTC